MKKHIVLVRPGIFGDTGSLDSVGIEQIENIVHYLKEVIAKEHILFVEILKAQGIRISDESSKIFEEQLHIPFQTSSQEFLRKSTHETEKAIMRKILEIAQPSQLTIFIAQTDNLQNIPKIMLEYLNKETEKFMKFATSHLNFQKKRGVHIAIGEDNHIHGIYSV